MGLKHGKYIYVERSDGWYVKVRVLGIRFKKKMEKEVDINDPSRYIVTNYKTKHPPINAIIVKEADLPEDVRKALHSI